MLYPNGQRIFAASPRLTAGALAATGAAGYGGILGARFNRYGTLSPVVGGLPSGYGGRSAVLPVRAGGLSSVVALAVAAAGAGVLGLPADGSASFVISVAPAEGQLISSGSGAATFTLTAAPLLLTASIGGTGSAAFTLTTNTPTLGAEAGLIGAASMSFAGTLTPYAIGSMSGSTVDTSVLTGDTVAAAVWSAAATANNAAGTMGSKLNTASSGGVDLGALASAVWGHTLRTLTDATQQAQLQDVWQRLGLDPANPQTTTTTTISAGPVQQSITEAAGTVTVTRLP